MLIHKMVGTGVDASITTFRLDSVFSENYQVNRVVGYMLYFRRFIIPMVRFYSEGSDSKNDKELCVVLF